MTYPRTLESHGPLRTESEARADVVSAVAADVLTGRITEAGAMKVLQARGWSVEDAADAISAAVGGEK